MTDILDIVSLKDIKTLLRVDFGDDDLLLLGILETARGYVEGWCGPLDDFTDGVPPAIVHGLKMYAGHLYEHREAVSDGGALAEAPMGFFDLIDPYRLREF